MTKKYFIENQQNKRQKNYLIDLYSVHYVNITKYLSMKKNTSHEIKVNELSEILNEKGGIKMEDPAMNDLAKLIQDYLKNEKPFIDPKFSLDDLAKQLDVPKHHLYYCLNSILNIKFITLRTQMRVEYAKELLLNGNLESVSMEGIWTKTGFSSRTNFFVTFKEVTGYTPLEFIKLSLFISKERLWTLNNKFLKAYLNTGKV